MVDLDLVLEASGVALLVGVGVVTSTRLAMRRGERRLGLTMRRTSDLIAAALAAEDPEDALTEMVGDLAGFFDAGICMVLLAGAEGDLTGGRYRYPPSSERDTFEFGPAEVAYRSGEAVIVPPDSPGAGALQGTVSSVAVPLHHQDRVTGVLIFGSSGRRFRRGDLSVLGPLADQIAAALANLELRRSAELLAARERKTRRGLESVSAVVMAGVASSGDLEAALHSMVREISARLGWESLAVVLFGADGKLWTRAYYGYPFTSTQVAFSPGEGVIGAVAASGRGRLIGDVDEDPDYLDYVEGTVSEMCVPLSYGGRILGVINVESPRHQAFTEDDFDLLGTLADQIAVVIEGARLVDLELEAIAKLKEADQLKEDFVATVSHELRTPLTSIKGFAQTLIAREDVLSPAERSDFLNVMVRHCDRLARIVDSLLLVSRLEAGEVGGKPTYLPLLDVLKDAAEASSSSDRIQIEADRGIGLVTDHFRLHHILRNLMENACKYSPDLAPVLVRARLEKGKAVVEVLDQGAGVPESESETIFERFRRLAGPGVSSIPGTGLGLYIARRFARDMGGDITVERADEEPWTGARFELSLPVELKTEGSATLGVTSAGI